MKILFLSRWLPYPPNNGSKLRIYNLLQALAQVHEITLLSFADPSELNLDPPELRAICQQVHIIPFKPFNPDGLKARLGFLSFTPRSVIDMFSVEMKQRLEEVLAANHYDAVVASQVDMAIYSRYFKGIPALLDELEVGVLYENFARASSLKQRFRHGLTWVKHRHYLLSILKNFRVCTVVSTQEHRLLSQRINYHPIEIMPNCVDLNRYAYIHENPLPGTLIFMGAFSYFPNYEAMVWFLQSVYPKIQARVPDVSLTITGNHQNRSLPSAANVTLTGFVDDVRPLVARSWISIVPLHTGGGTRLKILESMALRTPVIATSKGAEGLEAIPNEHLLVADSPEAFAEAVVRLLHDSKLRQQLVDKAYHLVQEKYSLAAVSSRFLSLVERVACGSDQL